MDRFSLSGLLRRRSIFPLPGVWGQGRSALASCRRTISPGAAFPRCSFGPRNRDRETVQQRRPRGTRWERAQAGDGQLALIVGETASAAHKYPHIAGHLALAPSPHLKSQSETARRLALSENPDGWQTPARRGRRPKRLHTNLMSAGLAASVAALTELSAKLSPKESVIVVVVPLVVAW